MKMLVKATEAVVRYVMTTVQNKPRNSGQHSSNADRISVTVPAALQNTAAAFKVSAQVFLIPVLLVAVVPVVAAPAVVPAVPVATVQIPAATVTAASNLATQPLQMKTVSTPVLMAAITA